MLSYRVVKRYWYLVAKPTMLGNRTSNVMTDSAFFFEDKTIAVLD